MEDDSSGCRSQQTLAKHRNSNGNGKRKIQLIDWPDNDLKGREGEKVDEDCDLEVWKTLSNSFNQVQSLLDQNNLLIQQVNENQQSKIPDNIAKNVALIREINANISKVVSLYSDLSADFSSMIHQHLETAKISTRGDNNDGEDIAAGLLVIASSRRSREVIVFCLPFALKSKGCCLRKSRD
ncbi:hypothetical protein V2J09_019110 [Rumex salicifolius]